MTTITKINPSGGSNGAAITVAATATAGTTFHTAHATAQDEVWMFLSNLTAADIVATIELGTVTANRNVKVTVPANDTVVALPGVPLTGGAVVGVITGGAANSLSMFGYVNRIT